MSTQLTAIEILRTMSINNDVDKMRQNAKGSIHIAGRMALAGQMTVFYASPNVGKTLITLKLIAEAIANGKAGKHVYYLNLDDTYEGLITKADLGNRYGFQVISSDNFSSPNKDFAAMVDCLISEGTAAGTVFMRVLEHAPMSARSWHCLHESARANARAVLLPLEVDRETLTQNF